MACPGGCTNGGGQIKVDDLGLGDRHREGLRKEGITQKEWLAKVDEAYFSMSDASGSQVEEEEEKAEDEGDGDVAMADIDDDDANGEGEVINGIHVKEVRDMLRHWSESTGIGLEKLCFTSFRAVESDVGKVGGVGGGGQDRVVELAGRIGGGW